MSNSRVDRNDKPIEKSKTSVFNRLGSSKSNSDKADICPSISKTGTCKNESNCKYYHPKSSDVDNKKIKNEDYDRKSRKEDSKIKSAVIVSGRTTDEKYKNDEKTDKSKLANSNRHQRSRSHSRSKVTASKNSDTRRSDNQGSKNMLDMDNTDQRKKVDISSRSDNRTVESYKTESSKKEENLKKRPERNKSRSRDDRLDKRDEKRKETTIRKRRHSSNSSDSSSSGCSSSGGSSRSSSSNSSSNSSKSSYEKKKNYKRKKDDGKILNDGHLKKLSTKPVSDKLIEKPQPIQTPKSSTNISKKEAIPKKEELSKYVESKRDSKSIKVVDKEVQKLEKFKTEKSIDSGKIKPLLSQEILASRIDKVNFTIDPKSEKKVEDQKTLQKTSKPLESKSSKDPKSESKLVKSPIVKSIEQKEEKIDETTTKNEPGTLVKSKGESKIVLKMLKPLNKMKKDVNTLAEKRNEPIKKSDASKSKSGDSVKPSLMKLKLEDPKNHSPKKIENEDKFAKREDTYNDKPDEENDNKRRFDKLTRNDESRMYDEQKIESSTRHSYGESEWSNKETSKRRVSPEFYSNKYSDSKRSRLSKYEHEHSIERSTDRDLGPPTLHHYSPNQSSSPKLRSHKRDRIDGDRHSDPDNVSRSSQHQYDDRYDSVRKVDVGMRRSVSGQRWDLARPPNIRAGEGDERYYDKQRISGGYDQRAYRDASYDRTHERVYERDLSHEHWNRSYERRHDDKSDLPTKEIWDDNYRRSDGYKSRSDWDKRHHDTGPSDEYRNRRDILLPPPPRIRSSSNLPLDHSNHLDNIQTFPDQDPSLDRSRGRAVEPPVPPKEEDVNDVNDILGTIDPKEDLEPDFESLPTRIPIVDMLEIKWKSLATGGGGCQVVSSSTSIIKRWQPTTILSKIGISRQFAGEELFDRVKDLCQKELESENENEKSSNCGNKASFNKFEFLSDIAFLHSNALKRKINRDKVVSDIGTCRRALSARTDLNIRRFLCKLDKEELLMFPVQMVDQDLHKQSLQMFLQPIK